MISACANQRLVVLPFSAGSEEFSIAACDNGPIRLELVRLYNEVKMLLYQTLLTSGAFFMKDHWMIQ